MERIECKTQAELEAAIRNGKSPVLIGRGNFEVRGDSSTVTAYDSSTVTAYDSSTVRACGSSTVRATPYSAIHQLSERVEITGGVVIKKPRTDTPEKWCEYYGVEVNDGVAVLYKALDDRFNSPHGGDYKPGTTPVADDWDGGESECGGGLHFSPRPFMAIEFNSGATKFAACPVALKDICIQPNPSMPQKVKARGCCSPVWECDEDGNRIEATASAKE